MRAFPVIAFAALLAGVVSTRSTLHAANPSVDEVKPDPKPIMARVVENRPRKDVLLKGQLFPTRRGDPVPFEMLINAEESGTRTLIRAGKSEWLVLQPDNGNPRWFEKGTGELTGDQRTRDILGSHFSAYDLAVPYLRWTDCDYVMSEVIKGRNCHVIEVRNETEPYRRAQLWIDSEMNGLLRAELYDPDGHMVKRFWVSSFRKLGEAWVPRGMDISWRPPGQSLPSEERSRLEVDDGKYDANLDDAQFDEKRFMKLSDNMTRETIYSLLFQEAGGTNSLEVALRAMDGKFTAGVTVGPLGPTTVDVSGLKRNGDELTGTLKATIGFDGYHPADGKPVTREYRLNAKISDGKISGTTKPDGKVTGTVSATPDIRGYWIMDLQLENGLGTGELDNKSYRARVYPKLYLHDGQFVQNLVYGWGGRAQLNYFESAIVTNQLTFDGRTLTGKLSAKTTAGEEYDFVMDGLAVGTQIGGTYQKRVNGKEVTGGPFHGKLQPQPAHEPDGALHYLELHNAVMRTWTNETARLQLMVFSPCLKGAFGSGIAFAGAWNHVYHDVDSSGLKLDGTSLSGELIVTMNPDPYVPPDHQAIKARYTIRAQVVDGRIVRGTYTGRFNDRPVDGPVYGELLDQPSVPDPVSIHVKLEDGLQDGQPWYRRIFIHFTSVKGKADHGEMTNNKGGWTGTFKQATVKVDGATFTAKIEGTVDKTKGPLVGDYTFELAGRVIGTQLVGKCDTYHGGKLVKSGTPFMGGFNDGQSPADSQ
jgi:hypothetical protein